MANDKSYAGYDQKLVDTITMNPKAGVYTKKKMADGNTEYTVKYETCFAITPAFTKILVGPNNDILAYIDVRRIFAPYKSQFKRWKWFGIQEFHPELIGDFTHLVTDNENESFFGTTWQHKTSEHTYILDTSNVCERKDWFRVEFDPLHGGNVVTTNFGVCDGSTLSYEYDTSPSVPAERIEKLKNKILIFEGVIKPSVIQSKLTFAQKIKRFFGVKSK